MESDSFPEAMETRSLSMLSKLVSYGVEASIDVLEEAGLKRNTHLENSLQDMPQATPCGTFIDCLDGIQGVKFNNDPSQMKLLR